MNDNILHSTLIALALTAAVPASSVALPAPQVDGRTDNDTVRTAGVDEQLTRLVDGFFREEMEEVHIPGGVFLLVRGSEISYAKGYGYADLERGLPVEPEITVWRVGSNSKTLTAAAALELAEQGLVRLDEDVNTYLTRVEVPATYPEPITLFNLLTHTAGFDERLFGQHAASPEDYEPLGEYLARKLPRRIVPPGQVISYNDHGTSLAGLVVEDVSGKLFAEYLRERIFEPLGMTRSTVRAIDLPGQVRENLAVAYRWTGEGHEPYEYDYIITGPAAGLMTTASDMGRFLAALLQGGRLEGDSILSPGTVEAMLSVQFRHAPKLRGRAFGFAESEENGVYGLYKDGQATGFTARIFLLPEHGIAFFSAINLSIFGSGGFNRAAGFHRRLTSKVLDHLFPPDEASDGPGEDAAASPSIPPDFEERAPRFAGLYRPMEGSRFTLEKVLFLFQGDIEVKDNGDGTLSIGFGRWVEIEPRLFQWHEGGPHYRAFGQDENGRISHLFIGPGAFERVPFFAGQDFTFRAVLVFMVLFLSALLVLPLSALFRRFRSVQPGERHPGRGALALAATLNLGFMVGFVAIFHFTDFQRFFKGVPPLMGVVLTLPILAGAIALALPFFSAAAWRRAAGGLIGRIHYSLVTLALLLFIPFLHYWNLLGWRY